MSMRLRHYNVLHVNKAFTFKKRPTYRGFVNMCIIYRFHRFHFAVLTINNNTLFFKDAQIPIGEREFPTDFLNLPFTCYGSMFFYVK